MKSFVLIAVLGPSLTLIACDYQCRDCERNTKGLSDVRSEVVQLRAQLGALNDATSEVVQLRAQLSALQAEIKSLREQVAALQNQRTNSREFEIQTMVNYCWTLFHPAPPVVYANPPKECYAPEVIKRIKAVEASLKSQSK